MMTVTKDLPTCPYITSPNLTTLSITAVLIHYFLLTISAAYHHDTCDNITTKEYIRPLEHNAHCQREPLLPTICFQKSKQNKMIGTFSGRFLSLFKLEKDIEDDILFFKSMSLPAGNIAI